MELERVVEDKIVIWSYDKLCVLASIGNLQIQLEDIEKMFKDFEIEFAPVQKRGFRTDFLAAFYFSPPIDVTLKRKIIDGETSIVTYSLNIGKSKQIIEQVEKRCGFVSFNPTEEFIQTLEPEINMVETVAYTSCQKIARALNTDLERVFATVRYSNFLTYTGMSEENTLRLVGKKFGLRI